MHDHVGHDLKRLVQMLIEEARVDHGIFPPGLRVEFAAEGIEYLGYLDSVKTGTALEEQVLDEMADAVFLRLLIAGARPYPEA